MPHYTVRHLKQKASYWAISGLNPEGQPTVSVGVELNVRWEEGYTYKIDGVQRVEDIDATVWVDRKISKGSILRKSCLVEFEESELFMVEKYWEVPDIKGRFFERIVFLRKYGDTLPTIS